MTRRYEQRLRAESVAATRRRILDAAHSLLRQAPAKPVSVDEVARNAAVVRSTVYTTFESRAGLFDALAAELRLEKIKTIGDAYMVVGGLPVHRADHADAVADMALEIESSDHVKAILRFTTPVPVETVDGVPREL